MHIKAHYVGPDGSWIPWAGGPAGLWSHVQAVVDAMRIPADVALLQGVHCAWLRDRDAVRVRFFLRDKHYTQYGIRRRLYWIELDLTTEFVSDMADRENVAAFLTATVIRRMRAISSKTTT